MKRLLFAIGLVVGSNTASANIYRYADETGRIFFSNRPHITAPPVATRAKSTTVIRPAKIAIRHTYTKHQIMNIARVVASRHHMDEKLIRAVIQTESAYKHDAVSRVGAVGLMQLMPDTATRFGVVDRTDPWQSIDGGTRYLKHLLKLFNGNKLLAVASYNAGENAVIRHKRAIPPYPETINYVASVMSKYNNIHFI